MSAETRIYLAGLSGAGKTTVAALLGRWLGARAGDVDTEVERAVGKPVAELWAAGGEAAFRAAEREAVALLVADGVTRVIALGGGTLEDPESRERLARWGTGVWLDAPAGTLAARIGNGTGRPLLAGAHPERVLRALAVERRPRYAALPCRVAADGPTAAAVGVAVMRTLGRAEPATLDGAVRVGRGALAAAGELLSGSGPLPVVTDARVWSLHGGALADALAARGWEVLPVELPEGEAAKAPDALGAIWRALAAVEAARDAPLAVLGGGALGDVGGLAAATFKRGLPLALFPTTLLAQVDAAIGGKNAIDLDGIKNAVGSFHDPVLVVSDTLCPLTQPDRDWRAGWAEIVKSGLIGDAALFELCEREVEAIGERRLAVVEEAIRRAVTVKLRIVATDPREAGPRRALNLGHTLGHAIEAAAGGALVHGEAISIGLAAAARLAERDGIADAGLAGRIEAVLSGLDLPVRPPADLDLEQVLAFARQDKKRAAGAVHAVLPLRPGAVEVRALDDRSLQQWARESLECGSARAGSAA